MIVLRNVQEIERRLYPSLQIFGGGQLLLYFLNQVMAGANPMSLWITGTLAAAGLAGALFALRWFDHIKGAAACSGFFWLIQVFAFATPWVSYTFFSGAQLLVSLEPTPLKLSLRILHLGMEFVARDSLEGPRAYIGVNLIAVAATRFFFKAWRTEARQSSCPVR